MSARHFITILPSDIAAAPGLGGIFLLSEELFKKVEEGLLDKSSDLIGIPGSRYFDLNSPHALRDLANYIERSHNEE